MQRISGTESGSNLHNEKELTYLGTNLLLRCPAPTMFPFIHAEVFHDWTGLHVGMALKTLYSESHALQAFV